MSVTSRFPPPSAAHTRPRPGEYCVPCVPAHAACSTPTFDRTSHNGNRYRSTGKVFYPTRGRLAEQPATLASRHTPEPFRSPCSDVWAAASPRHDLLKITVRHQLSSDNLGQPSQTVRRPVWTPRVNIWFAHWTIGDLVFRGGSERGIVAINPGGAATCGFRRGRETPAQAKPFACSMKMLDGQRQRAQS